MKRIFLVLALLLSFPAFSEWSGYKKITYLKAQTGGVHFILESFVNNYDVTEGCSNNFWMPQEDNYNYDARVSFLLSAFMSGKAVNISFGECSSSHIKASSVAIKPE